MTYVEGAGIALSPDLLVQQKTDIRNIETLAAQIEADFPQLGRKIDTGSELRMDPTLYYELHSTLAAIKAVNGMSGGQDDWSDAVHAVHWGELLVRRYFRQPNDLLEVPYTSRLVTIDDNTGRRYDSGATTAGDVLEGIFGWIDRNNGFDRANIGELVEASIKFAQVFMAFPIHWALYFNEAFTAEKLDDSLGLEEIEVKGKKHFRLKAKEGSLLANILRFKSTIPSAADRAANGRSEFYQARVSESNDYLGETEEEVIQGLQLFLEESKKDDLDSQSAQYYANGILQGLKAIPREFWTAEALAEIKSGNWNDLIDREAEPFVIWFDKLENPGKTVSVLSQDYHYILQSLFREGTAIREMMQTLKGEATSVADYAMFGFDPASPEARRCPALPGGAKLLAYMARAAGYALLDKIGQQELGIERFKQLNVNPDFVSVVESCARLVSMGISQRQLGRIVFGERGIDDLTRSPGRRIGEFLEVIKRDLFEWVGLATLPLEAESGLSPRIRAEDAVLEVNSDIAKRYLDDTGKSETGDLSTTERDQLLAEIWYTKHRRGFAERLSRAANADKRLSRRIGNGSGRILGLTISQIAENLDSAYLIPIQEP